jgi:hypothetical protein
VEVAAFQCLYRKARLVSVGVTAKEKTILLPDVPVRYGLELAGWGKLTVTR